MGFVTHIPPLYHFMSFIYIPHGTYDGYPLCRVLAYRLFVVLHATRNKRFLILSWQSVIWTLKQMQIRLLVPCYRSSPNSIKCPGSHESGLSHWENTIYILHLIMWSAKWPPFCSGLNMSVWKIIGFSILNGKIYDKSYCDSSPCFPS